MASFDKIIVVTKATALDELIQRFNTKDQARFYIEHMGGSFAEYEAAHAAYQQARKSLSAALPRGARVQWIDRSFLPTFIFGGDDLVVTLGPDGLVVNTAKYLNGQRVLAFNPDAGRIDGVLLPYDVAAASAAFHALEAGEVVIRNVSMAQADLNDGQSLLAVNDLFIGVRSHGSARYRIQHGDREETQSSSGVIVSTGAGSTGWYRSLVTGATGIAASLVGVVDEELAADVAALRDNFAFDWESDYLMYTVREPFVSRTSSAELLHGRIEAGEELVIVSNTPRNGVIFSDGVEEDFLNFNSGATARVHLSERTLQLVTPKRDRHR